MMSLLDTHLVQVLLNKLVVEIERDIGRNNRVVEGRLLGEQEVDHRHSHPQ